MPGLRINISYRYRSAEKQMKRVFGLILVLTFMVWSNSAFGASIDKSGGKGALVVEDEPKLVLPGSPIQFYSFGETPIYFGPQTEFDDSALKAGGFFVTGNTFFNFTGDPQLAVFRLSSPSAGVSTNSVSAPVAVVPEPGTSGLLGAALAMMLAAGFYRWGALRAPLRA
jgi:hypothetical protein